MLAVNCRSSTSSRSISKSGVSPWSREDQSRRVRAGDLPAELGADRAPGARDQHGLAREVGRDRLQVDLDRLAAEDVLDLDRTDLRGEVVLVGDQLVEAGERLHGNALPARDLDDMLALLARGGRDRDQELVRPVVAQDVRELVRRPEHADAVDAEVLLARVVVDDPDRRVAELARALHLLDHELTRVAGADDDHFLAAGDQSRRATAARRCSVPGDASRRRARGAARRPSARRLAGAGARTDR